MMAEKFLTPNIPKLDMVNVPPCKYSHLFYIKNITSNDHYEIFNNIILYIYIWYFKTVSLFIIHVLA